MNLFFHISHKSILILFRYLDGKEYEATTSNKKNMLAFFSSV